MQKYIKHLADKLTVPTQEKIDATWNMATAWKKQKIQRAMDQEQTSPIFSFTNQL